MLPIKRDIRFNASVSLSHEQHKVNARMWHNAVEIQQICPTYYFSPPQGI
jgi:hypothetical protein